MTEMIEEQVEPFFNNFLFSKNGCLPKMNFYKTYCKTNIPLGLGM